MNYYPGLLSYIAKEKRKHCRMTNIPFIFVVERQLPGWQINANYFWEQRNVEII